MRDRVSESNARSNNFNAFRLIAASLVMFEHVHAFQGQSEPFFDLTGYHLGYSCVHVFFAIAGYLVTQSLDRRSFPEFLTARALRLFPGLAVCCATSVLGLSLLSSLPMGDYFSDPRTLRFVVGNSSLLSMQFYLPGVFTANRLHVVNGSLWTLPFEVSCYLAFGVMLAGTTRSGATRKLLFAGVSFVFAAIFVAIPHLPPDFFPSMAIVVPPLVIPYLVGAIVASSDEKLTLRDVALAGVLVALTRNSALEEPVYAAFIAVITLWAARVQHPLLRRFNALPDYSYGIYIYAYPVQQVVAHFAPDMGTLPAILIAFPPTLALAAFSWTFVEKPCLALKSWARPVEREPAALCAAARSD